MSHFVVNHGLRVRPGIRPTVAPVYVHPDADVVILTLTKLSKVGVVQTAPHGKRPRNAVGLRRGEPPGSPKGWGGPPELGQGRLPDAAEGGADGDEPGRVRHLPRPWRSRAARTAFGSIWPGSAAGGSSVKSTKSKP